MAKGNVLLGQIRGKVGDVLFKHVGGQQITSAVIRGAVSQKIHLFPVMRKCKAFL